MSRIRSVHPKLWTDEEFVALPMAARLFLIGLWGEADDFGLFDWKPLGLKMRLAPADAIDAAEVLDTLRVAGFVVKLEREGKGQILIRLDRPRGSRPPEPRTWQATRLRIFTRDGFICTYCGGEDHLHCDHIHPVSRGGSGDDDNLTTACRRCNTSKRDRLLSEWRR